MFEGAVARRLAAIVAVDVAGYSRLMGADEAGTLARLKEHRDVTNPIAKTHGGRLFGTAGDGLLYEFPSVVDAVACIVEIQRVMVERNAGFADGEEMLYRFGINLRRRNRTGVANYPPPSARRLTSSMLHSCRSPHCRQSIV